MNRIVSGKLVPVNMYSQKLLQHEMNAPVDGFDYHMEVKVEEHPIKEDDPRETLFANTYLHQTVKQEVDTSGDEYEYLDVKVEEHPIQVEFKQESKPCSNLSLSVNTQSITSHDKCFSIKNTLVQHLKTHTGEKRFKCIQCDKCFTHKSTLVNHQRTHTGEKPFQCSYCDKWFSKKSNLVDHQRTHTGEKPYQCSHCDSCFALKTTLVDHQRTHTGEKPYQCIQCIKCFAYRSNLARHLKTH